MDFELPEVRRTPVPQDFTERQFEDLAAWLVALGLPPHVGRPIRVLGQGFHSTAIETGSGFIIRIGRTPEASASYEIEAKLLPLVADYLDLSIPIPIFFKPAAPAVDCDTSANPRQHGDPGEDRWHTSTPPTIDGTKTETDHPADREGGDVRDMSARLTRNVGAGGIGPAHGVIAYEKLPGVPLTPRLLTTLDRNLVASEIATFLRSLHTFPPALAAARGVPGPLTPSRVEAVRRNTLPALSRLLGSSDLELLRNWFHRVLADPSLWRFTPVLCHGDLWFDHLLVDPEPPGRLLSAVDFGGMHLGDPAHGDLAPLLYLGPDLVARVILELYPSGDATVAAARTETYWQLRELYGVEYSLRYRDQAELDESLRKLRSGAVLRPDLHPSLVDAVAAGAP